MFDNVWFKCFIICQNKLYLLRGIEVSTAFSVCLIPKLVPLERTNSLPCTYWTTHGQPLLVDSYVVKKFLRIDQHGEGEGGFFFS